MRDRDFGKVNFIMYSQLESSDNRRVLVHLGRAWLAKGYHRVSHHWLGQAAKVPRALSSLLPLRFMFMLVLVLLLFLLEF